MAHRTVGRLDEMRAKPAADKVELAESAKPYTPKALRVATNVHPKETHREIEADRIRQENDHICRTTVQDES